MAAKRYYDESLRLPQWNYGWQASYFITVCTKDRLHWFGTVQEREMLLSDTGRLVYSEWLRTPELRPDMNIELGAFVVMPNHFHGILSIGRNAYNSGEAPLHGNTDRKRLYESLKKDAAGESSGKSSGVYLTEMAIDAFDPAAFEDKLLKPPPKRQNQFGPQAKNLASVMRGFKSAVTIQARQLEPNFGWQSRFYEHVIRGPNAYGRISQYIINNPKKWEEHQHSAP